MGAGIGARRGAGTGARIEMRVEGRERLGTYEMVIDAGWKTREGGSMATCYQHPRPQDQTP